MGARVWVGIRIVIWVVYALGLLASGFALVDAVRQLRAVQQLERGGFDAEVAELGLATDPDSIRALRNELTLNVEAALAASSVRKGAHARICAASGVVVVVLSVQQAPSVAMGAAAIAAVCVALTLGLDRATRRAAQRARARWRHQLGATGAKVKHGPR